MTDNGDPCPKCKTKQMPKWDRGTTARKCQNPGCGFMEERDKCRVLGCRGKALIRAEYQGMFLDVCYEHSKLDFRVVKKMMERGEI